MKEFIEKSQLKNAVKQFFNYAISRGRYKVDACDTKAELCAVISAAPPAKVKEIVPAFWLPTKDKDKKKCSNCEVIHMIAQYPAGNANWCPNCGAEMSDAEDAIIRFPNGGMPTVITDKEEIEKTRNVLDSYFNDDYVDTDTEE